MDTVLTTPVVVLPRDPTSCAQLASHLMHVHDLPIECQTYRDVVQDLQRRETDTTHPTQWLS